ncbi:MAG: LCP family protein [Pseudonocardia sp.]|nr:LCP family protein [Pseudonocardia sp.]MBO0872714.1 LCP family protein [Pseudonocardia sp.]
MNRGGGGPRSWGQPPPPRRPPPPPGYPYGPRRPPYRPTAVLPPGWHQGGPPPRGYQGPPRVPPQRPAPPQARSGPPRRRHWGRRLLTLLVVLVLVLLGIGGYLDTRLTRTAALTDYPGRPDSSGTNWLIVGSDSRADLTEQQEQALATGNAAGARTDTIMLLHTGSAGTTLVSLPRDSLVAIPGKGRNKLNAAFSLGGPKLLTQTVEQATGLRVDHYAQIGFDGFVKVVDAVGGVDMCIPEAMKDPLAGLNVKAGCQTLDGQTALGYVRSRATARADLERVEHQRQFLSALMKKVVSPVTLINPFRLVGLTEAMPGAVTVGTDDHVWHLAGLALAMRELSGGGGVTTTVPIGGFASLNGGSVVRWDTTRAKEMFGALAADQSVPKSALG